MVYTTRLLHVPWRVQDKWYIPPDCCMYHGVCKTNGTYHQTTACTMACVRHGTYHQTTACTMACVRQMVHTTRLLHVPWRVQDKWYIPPDCCMYHGVCKTNGTYHQTTACTMACVRQMVHTTRLLLVPWCV